jgi:hypothetical protein|tara:strand:- start:31 stop:255 length:225 start_codon:yes stop_codon:yes gene_type:complete
MEKYLRVETDKTHVRDMESNAIVNRNKGEFDKFMELSKRKYEEKRKFDDMRSDLDSLKQDMNEIKTLLLDIMNK